MLQGHQNCHIYSFVYVNDKASEYGLQRYGQLGCVILRYVAPLWPDLCACTPFYFSTLFFFFRFIALSASLFCDFWYSPVPAPPIVSRPLVVCTTYTWLQSTFICVSLSLYWLSFAWMSDPHLYFTYHAWIPFIFLQCWLIGCHTSFHQTSSWGAQHLSLYFTS